AWRRCSGKVQAGGRGRGVYPAPAGTGRTWAKTVCRPPEGGGPMFFNPTELLLLIPAIGGGGVGPFGGPGGVFPRHAVAARSGASGADAAAAVLESAGVNGVYVEDATGQQLDHYSPAEKGLQLRPEIYSGRTLAAVGIAAHETGHALQDADGHPLLAARTAIVLSATCGSLIGLILLI